MSQNNLNLDLDINDNSYNFDKKDGQLLLNNTEEKE